MKQSANTDALLEHLASSGAKKRWPPPLALSAGWLFVLGLYFAIALALHGLRPDITIKLQQMPYVLELSCMAFLATTAALSASFLALPDIGQRPGIRYLPLIPLALLAVLLAEGILSGQSLRLSECLQLKRFDCFLDVILFSLLPAGAMLLWLRRAAPTQSGWAGAMAGLSASSIGYLFMRLITDHDDSMALAVWHFTPVIALVLLSILIGGKFLRGRV